ncbi:MAG TPA: APC family permease [Candidatus Aquilonibacter sp.]|jgi:APA family basic amino acid/polyamine antiporter|nr:APC family permease [Candidatus Aquilonibacter sp.]
MSQLARKLRLTDYFTLAWGTMVGVGWLVVMDDWLLRGGALGALLGFAVGGALLFPIGWVYGRLVAAMPNAAGEIAYTAAAFSSSISYSTGWMMMLAYFIVCPWEAVAVGRIAGYIVPSLDSLELYRIAGRPVYLPHLIIGLTLTALLTTLNYRGIRLSASFQNWTAFTTLALFVTFIVLGVSKGSPHNFPPLFTHAPLFSFLLVLQIVPYFMTGFESVSKAAEESTAEFHSARFLTAIWMAILIGIFFYTAVIAAVAFVAPWHELTGEKFMTAVAFQRATGSRWIVNVILAAALLSLIKCFNGNFVAASRMLFAMGRRELIDVRAGRIHPQHQTPSVAVLCIGVVTAACMLLGDAILVPITEVGAVASAIGWTATCAAYLSMRRRGKLPEQSKRSTGEYLVAGFGLLVAIAMLLMKVVPAIPGHFTLYEWLALGIWIVVGAIVRLRPQMQRS